MAAVAVLAWGLAHWIKSAQSTGVLAAKDSVASSVASQKSVAVLPFDNFSAERDTDYLSDGLTEEITAALSRVPGLRVAARNSAFTFKSKKEDLRKVGKTLGVATILEGSLRKSGPQIRVTAQLINAVDGYHLWSESYDSSMSDIIAVQEDIAGKIAERFELKARNEAPPGTARRNAPNQEAYGLYLKGLHFWNKRTKEDLETAAQLFNQAADKDPTYAPAFAGLALTHVLLPDYASRPQMEYFPLARAEAQKTLALDPASADAHAALALVDAYTRQYKAAEDEFKQALRLNPNHATAHHWYGVHLRETDRMDEAIAELRRAEALDPLSPIIKLNILTWQGYARQYDQSLEECNRDLEQFPDFALFMAARAWLLERKGRYPEALAQILKVRAGMTNSPYFLEYVGFIYARSGDETNARKCLAELEDWKTRGYAVRTGIAQVHLGLREYDLALDELNEALTQGDTVSGLLKDPTLDDLRPLPRFQSLLQKAGLKNLPP